MCCLQLSTDTNAAGRHKTDKEQGELNRVQAQNIRRSLHPENMSFYLCGGRVAREIERSNAKKLTKQAPILEVLNRLETDGASKQQQIEELNSEIKVQQAWDAV